MTFVALATIVAKATGCTSGNPERNPIEAGGGGHVEVTDVDSGAALCAAAGGHCLREGPCTLVGPPQACSPDQVGGSFCCAPVFDGGGCKGPIEASSYDQSCTTDTDCVAISAQDSCSLCAFNCNNATINVSAMTRYESDIDYTTANFSSHGLACLTACIQEGAPCCVGGTCQLGSQCVGDAPVVDPGTDSGTDAAAADSSGGDAAD